MANIETVRKLLAKAHSTDFAEEAESFESDFFCEAFGEKFSRICCGKFCGE